MADRLASALEAAGVPYAIGGALCLAAWGTPRATKDVDLNVFVADERAGEVLPVFAAAGCTFDADAARRSALERGDMVPVHACRPVDAATRAW